MNEEVRREAEGRGRIRERGGRKKELRGARWEKKEIETKRSRKKRR